MNVHEQALIKNNIRKIHVVPVCVIALFVMFLHVFLIEFRVGFVECCTY